MVILGKVLSNKQGTPHHFGGVRIMWEVCTLPKMFCSGSSFLYHSLAGILFSVFSTSPRQWCPLATRVNTWKSLDTPFRHWFLPSQTHTHRQRLKLLHGSAHTVCIGRLAGKEWFSSTCADSLSTSTKLLQQGREEEIVLLCKEKVIFLVFLVLCWILPYYPT